MTNSENLIKKNIIFKKINRYKKINKNIKKLAYIDMNFPTGCFCDRLELEKEMESVDVILPTLDAGNFLESCLYTVFKEIPVNNLIVCDGGSKDNTIEILKNFPRVVIHQKPELKTTGKTLEFLIEQTQTDWFVLIDGDLELSPGWYDEMIKHKNEFDVIENSKSINHFHIYRENKEKLELLGRSLTMCHMVKKSAVQEFHCDDDYMWRYTDFLFRQIVEKSGYRYGKINTTTHTHNETERIPYSSDTTKNYSKIIAKEPERIILDKVKHAQKMMEGRKAIVKYLDPEFSLCKDNIGFEFLIRKLDREWVKTNGPKWLARYDKSKSMKFTFMNMIYTNFYLKNNKFQSYLKKLYNKNSKKINS